MNSFADLLLGDIAADNTFNSSATYATALTTYALYLADTYNVLPKLTLNFGARYDKLLPFQMLQGGLATFDPVLGKVVAVAGTPDATIAPLFPYVLGSQVGYTTQNWIHLQNLNIAPRVGFAYRPLQSGRMVVRGGYGIFYDNLSFQFLVNNLANQFPFVLNESHSSPSGSTPGLTFENAFPATGLSGGNPNVFAVQRDFKTPYNEQWNLTVEGVAVKNIAVRVTYLGNLGTHLFLPYPLNDYIPQPIGGAGNPASTQLARPYQPWGSITQYTSGASTNLQELQLAAQRRVAGLTFNIQYQHLKALGVDGPNNETAADKSDIRYEYGNLDFLAQNALSASYTYDLPIGTGKALLAHVGPRLNKVVSGWHLNGVVKAQTGKPFSVNYSTTIIGSPDPALGPRASRVPGVNLYPQHQSPSEWCNPAAFQTPAPYTFGNSQRNSIYGPAYEDWDAALFKQTQITERVKFEFRFETFNVLNHPSFGQPSNGGNNINSANVGTITTTSGNNRELQFGGRLSF